ncbi:MAG: CHAT domain-containing protein [Bacteroidota bacterium]
METKSIYIFLFLLVCNFAVGQSCYDSCIAIEKEVNRDYLQLSLDDYRAYNDKLQSLSQECDSCYNSIFKIWQWAVYKFRNYKIQSDHLIALDTYEQAFVNYLPRDTFDYTDRLLTTYLRKGHYHFNYGELEKAFHAYALIINAIDQGAPYNYAIHETKNIAYQRMAGIESKRSNWNKAKRIYQYAIEDELVMAEKENKAPVVFSIYSKLAEIDQKQKKFESAYNHYERCNTVLRKKMILKSRDEMERLVYQYASRFLGQIDAAIALERWEKVEELFSWIDELPLLSGSAKNISIDLSHLKYALAIDDTLEIRNYSTLIQEKMKIHPTEFEFDVEYKLLHARNLVEKHRYAKANTWLSSIDELCQQYPLRLDGARLESWLLQAQILTAQSNKDELTLMMKDVQAHLRKRFTEYLLFSDHIQSVEVYYSIYEFYLDVLYRAKSSDYELIFGVIEDLKSLNLLLTHRQSLARRNLNNSLSVKLNKTSSELLAIRHQMQLSEDNYELRNREFKLTERLDSIRNQWGQEYTNSKDTAVSLDILIEHLPESSCYITFFAGRHHYYGLAVSDEKNIKFERFSRSRIDSLVLDIKNEIVLPTSMDRLLATGRNLYNALDGLIEKDGNHSLILSLDGNINELPFESLVNPNDEFIIQQHDISYSPSARMYLELNEGDHNVRSTGIFMPTFDSQSVYYLPFAHEEADYIKTITGGHAYEATAANKINFSRAAQKHGIIHLTTHAVADKSSLGQNYIMLNSANGDESERLYEDEIAHMDLPLDMICLSACKTGSGKLAVAEGILSIGRSFMAIGCKAVVSTLWSIPDQTSSEIMQHFYTELSKGLPKNTALANAKRKFLVAKKGEARHPHYWAGYTVNGNINPIFHKPRFSQITVVMGLIFFLLMGLIGVYVRNIINSQSRL